MSGVGQSRLVNEDLASQNTFAVQANLPQQLFVPAYLHQKTNKKLIVSVKFVKVYELIIVLFHANSNVFYFQFINWYRFHRVVKLIICYLFIEINYILRKLIIFFTINIFLQSTL